MELTSVEREKITDTMLHVESARSSFDQVENGKVPKGNEIEKCLEEAHESLKTVLGYSRPKPKKTNT